jgi:dihydrofolate reductase
VRNLVLAMMTTVNGRLDDPGAWMTGVGDDVFADIDRSFEDFDTILVGMTTYAEMVAYWPNAEAGGDAFAGSSSSINQRMARKMNAYKKYVFSRHEPKGALEWNNADQITVRDDDDIIKFVHELKVRRAGGSIHLAGGAQLAQTFVRLGLVDELNFKVHPVLSIGARWFDQLEDGLNLDLVSVTPYEDGVVGVRYRPGKNAS